MRRRTEWLLQIGSAALIATVTAGWSQGVPRGSVPSSSPATNADSGNRFHNDPVDELQAGARLTGSGALREAIPHLLAAQSDGADPYATGVNLAICYVGTGASAQAIPLLESLRASGYRTSATATLLVQAYIATHRLNDAYALLKETAEATPEDETIFAYAADACNDSRQYALGLRMMDLGLTKRPASARLHYEKALFLAQLGSIERARPEFDRAAELDRGGYIGSLSGVQKDLYNDDLKGANALLDQAIHTGHSDYRMLSLLGTVLLQEGAAPGEPRFAEAESALEESAKERPDFSATQIALGKIDLMLSRYREAVGHLEIARAIEPENPAVYASLALAYRRLGKRDKASEVSAQLGRLLARQAPKAPPPAGSGPQ